MTRLVIVMVLCVQTMAQAQEPDLMTQARAHFDAGRTLYDAGAYPDALREFELGYQLSHKPRFLLNVAQTYRKLNELVRAREAIVRFLDETPAGDPYRATAEALRKEIDAADRRAAPPAPPPPITPPPERKPLARRAWVWGVVAGGLVVVGGAIALGVVLGSSSQYPSGLKVAVQ